MTMTMMMTMKGMHNGDENVEVSPADFEGPSSFQLFRQDRRASRPPYTIHNPN